ncbi:MAG: barstar family protein [Marmoricola sp.]
MGLAAILAGHEEPGVHLWHTGFGVRQVRHSVEHAGWRFAWVDGLTHQDKTGFLKEVGAALSFPGWYGENFDALADCLRDVSGPDRGGTVVLWDCWGPFARGDRSAFDVAVDVLRKRAADTPSFTVLLRGDGPDVEVPTLDA